MNGQPCGVGGETEQVGRGPGERDAERGVVDDGDAHVGKRLQFPGVEGLGVFDWPEHVGVDGAKGGGEDALKRIGEVGGGHAVAVGPFGVGAEVKRVGQTVGGDVPAFGDTRDGAAGFFVVADQALVERDGDVHVGGGLDEGGVEGGGLVLIADEERLRADALLHGRLALGAGGKNESARQEAEGGAEGRRHPGSETVARGGSENIF